MYRVKKGFKASENGIDVVEYPKGIYESLPKTAETFAVKNDIAEAVEPSDVEAGEEKITLGEDGLPVIPEIKAAGPIKNKASGVKKTK